MVGCDYETIDYLTIRLTGAEAQNRTADTAVFSRVLYQLSYLGARAIIF